MPQLRLLLTPTALVVQHPVQAILLLQQLPPHLAADLPQRRLHQQRARATAPAAAALVVALVVAPALPAGLAAATKGVAARTALASATAPAMGKGTGITAGVARAAQLRPAAGRQAAAREPAPPHRGRPLAPPQVPARLQRPRLRL